MAAAGPELCLFSHLRAQEQSMSATTNPDRVYVNRQYRAKLRLDQEEAALFGASATSANVALPGIGAALVDISAGGCCLRLTRSTLRRWR